MTHTMKEGRELRNSRINGWQDIRNLQSKAAGILNVDISVPGQSDAPMASYTDAITNAATNDYMSAGALVTNAAAQFVTYS